MENKSEGSTTGCMILVIIALIPLLISQIWIAPSFISAQKAGCSMVESALSQMSPEERTDQPQTAEQCIAMVEASSFILRGIVAFGSYVVSGVALGFLYTAYLIFGGGMRSSKRKNTSETGAVS